MKHRIATTAEILRVTLLLACVISAGCVVVPVPTHDDLVMRGYAPATNALAAVRINETDKATVLQTLGPPAAIWEDQQIFLYWWDARWGKVYWFVAAGATGGGVGGGAGMGVIDVSRPRALCLQFDEHDRVRRMEPMSRSASGSMGADLAKWAGMDGSRKTEKEEGTKSKSILLFRVVATSGGKPLQEAARGLCVKPGLIGGRTLLVGLGSFNSAGMPLVRKPGMADAWTRTNGWLYYEIDPGTYYIGIDSFHSCTTAASREAPHGFKTVFHPPVTRGVQLRAQVPVGSEIVYGGTVHVDCITANHICSFLNSENTRIEDESALAAEITAKWKPGARWETRLMELHTGPYVVRTPERMK